MGDLNIPIIEPIIDYTKVPPINQKRTVTFINHFIVNTVTFLNKFTLTCEERLFEFENKLQRVQASLEILESRLKSISGLEIEGKLQERKNTTDDGQVEISDKSEKVQADIAIEQKDERMDSLSGKSENKESELETEKQSIAANPMYQKYFKMLQFGVPKPAVRLKMEQEGLDPSILD